jgi:protein SCO1/2
MSQPVKRKRNGTPDHAPRAGKTKATTIGSLVGLIVAAAVAAAGLGGLIWWETGPARPQGGPLASAGSGIGGPFHMIDQDGRPVDQHVLDGHWTAVFFGYTYCPDVCPATLQALAQAAKQLGPKANTLQVVFVSIDPDRDHPKEMKAYIDAQAIPVKTVGLTGTPAEVATIAKAYKVYYAKVGTGAEYSMDHTAVIYLMDPKGRFASPLTHGMAPDKIAGEIVKAEAG